MGDPQAPFAKVLEVLRWHRALAGDRIAPDVVLVSIGDHFDYDFRNPTGAARDGLALLRWLASHDPEQVVLLLGNHDASRVMELAQLTDEQFEVARRLARTIDEAERETGRAAARARAEYEAAFPELPPPGVLGRDYASFTTEQRALVQELLLAGRFQLAVTGALPDGREALITHAGVTARELGLLDHDEAVPRAIASALDAQLAAAVDVVRAEWQRGRNTPLSLAPLHVTGSRGEEGGGLLYHRPSNPDHAGADKAWGLAASRPRRFDPRTLPVGITQIVGHSGHAKCVHELGPWVAEPARMRKHGGIRTLRVYPAAGGATVRVVYDMGIAPRADAVADLILIDGELRRVPAAEVALLPLARLR